MDQKKSKNHPLIASLTDNQRDAVWHGFREKYPNFKWGFTFFGMWLVWVLGLMTLSSFLEKFVDGLGMRLLVHFIVTLCAGVIGGVVVFGSFMLQRRRKAYHEYLNGNTLEKVQEDLGVPGICAEK